MKYQLSLKDVQTNVNNGVSLQHISFDVAPGEIYGIVGLWNSGKSAILEVIAHLKRPDKGSIYIMGEEETDQHHTPIGVLIKRPGFLPGFSVMDNLLAQCNLFRIKNPGKHAKHLIKRFKLDKQARKPVAKLTEDQKQRLGIAMALVSLPPVILLDEPFEHLEPASLSLVKKILQDLCQKEELSIVITSKMVKPIQDVAHRFCIMSEGSMIREVNISDIKDISFSRICLEVDQPDFAMQMLTPYHPMVIDKTFYINYQDDDILLNLNRLLYEHGITVTKALIEKEDMEQSYYMLTEKNNDPYLFHELPDNRPREDDIKEDDYSLEAPTSIDTQVSKDTKASKDTQTSRDDEAQDQIQALNKLIADLIDYTEEMEAEAEKEELPDEKHTKKPEEIGKRGIHIPSFVLKNIHIIDEKGEE